MTADLGPVDALDELDKCANPSACGGSDGVEARIAELRGGGQGFGDPRTRRLSRVVGAGHVAVIAGCDDEGMTREARAVDACRVVLQANDVREMVHQCVAVPVGHVRVGPGGEQGFGGAAEPVEREQCRRGHAVSIRLREIGALAPEQLCELVQRVVGIERIVIGGVQAKRLRAHGDDRQRHALVVHLLGARAELEQSAQPLRGGLAAQMREGIARCRGGRIRWRGVGRVAPDRYQHAEDLVDACAAFGSGFAEDVGAVEHTLIAGR